MKSKAWYEEKRDRLEEMYERNSDYLEHRKKRGMRTLVDKALERDQTTLREIIVEFSEIVKEK